MGSGIETGASGNLVLAPNLSATRDEVSIQRLWCVLYASDREKRHIRRRTGIAAPPAGQDFH